MESIVTVLLLICLSFVSAEASAYQPQLKSNAPGWKVEAQLTTEELILKAIQNEKISQKNIRTNEYTDLLELKMVSTQKRVFAVLEAKARPRGQGRVFQDFYILVFELTAETPVLLEKKLLRTEIHDAKGIYTHPDFNWKLDVTKQDATLILFNIESTERHALDPAPRGRHGIN